MIRKVTRVTLGSALKTLVGSYFHFKNEFFHFKMNFPAVKSRK